MRIRRRRRRGNPRCERLALCRQLIREEQRHLPREVFFVHHTRLVPRQALRGGIQKSIFKHISGNRVTSRPKVDNSAPMAPITHLRYPHEGPSVGERRLKAAHTQLSPDGDSSNYRGRRDVGNLTRTDTEASGRVRWAHANATAV